MEKCKGEGHCHLLCAGEGGSESPDPVEETTVMSQGVTNMWYCWESKRCSCSKTAGKVVTEVPVRSGMTTKGVKEWVEAWQGENFCLDLIK